MNGLRRLGPLVLVSGTTLVVGGVFVLGVMLGSAGLVDDAGTASAQEWATSEDCPLLTGNGVLDSAAMRAHMDAIHTEGHLDSMSGLMGDMSGMGGMAGGEHDHGDGAHPAGARMHGAMY